MNLGIQPVPGDVVDRQLACFRLGVGAGALSRDQVGQKLSCLALLVEAACMLLAEVVVPADLPALPIPVRFGWEPAAVLGSPPKVVDSRHVVLPRLHRAASSNRRCR